MKVKLESGYRDRYTLRDLERARAVIAQEKEDLETAEGWSEYAIKEALRDTSDYWLDVLNATAYTAKNYRVWNAYGEESGDMDIWIEATAETAEGFIRVGAYLSDIWNTGVTEYKQHMYIRYFKEVSRP